MCQSCPVLLPEEHLTTAGPVVAGTEWKERTVSEYVLWFDDYEEAHRPRVGGKNASLGTMLGAGLPVPPGFAVTTDAYELLRSHRDIVDGVNGALARVDFADPSRLQHISREVREMVETVPLPAAVEKTVRSAYADLCARCGTDRVPVAVRSSATAEDLPDASFAGQQDTFLWVTGAEDVLQFVRKCWSSIFTDRAIAYRHEMGYDHQLISMSVGVQKMVDPKAAGVAFTLNPLNGDRSQVAIDASWGLGEAVVSGEVTPDNFLVDKVLRTIVNRIISPKTIEYRVTDGGVERRDVEPERQSVPALTDEEVCAVAAMARRAEKHYGRPQDIEWAIDRHLPEGDNVILLQARPETVWSRKPKSPIARDGYDPMKSIVSTLISPTHSRDP